MTDPRPFIEERLSKMLTSPRGWGTWLAVECQIISLLEVWHVASGNDLELAYDTYPRFWRFAYAQRSLVGNFTLSARVDKGELSEGDFIQLLTDFVTDETQVKGWLQEHEVWGWEWEPIDRNKVPGREASFVKRDSGTVYIQTARSGISTVIAITGPDISCIFGPGLKADARRAVAEHEQLLASQKHQGSDNG